MDSKTTPRQGRREKSCQNLGIPPYLQRTSLNRWEAWEYLAWKHDILMMPSKLEELADEGLGPWRFIIGETPMYPTAQLDRWAQQQSIMRQKQ